MSDAPQPSEQAPSRFGASGVPTQFKKGQSGNPAGRPKGIEALARQHTAVALEALVKALDNPATVVPAAVALLDRGWGRPKQTIAGDPDNPLMTYVLRAPSPVDSASEWLRLHAPSDSRSEPMVIDANETIAAADEPT